MALQDGYLFHVVAALGLESQIPTNFVQGEIGFITDRIEMIVGDGSPTPARIVTDKTLGAYSLASLSQLTLPSGLVVQQSKPGSVGAITPARMTAGLGLLAFRGNDGIGQDLWANIGMTSSDQTLLVTNPNGALGTAIDMRINPNSDILKNLIRSLMGSLFSGRNGILVDPVNLYIESTLGLNLRPLATFADPNVDRLDLFTAGAAGEISPANLVASMLLAGTGIQLGRDPTTNKVTITNTGAGTGGGGTTTSTTGVAPLIHVLTSSQTWTPTAGFSRAIAIATGGGGGGGGANNSSASAGGSAGGTAIKAFSYNGITSIAATIGGGGTGGAAGLGLLGTAGGTTTLGSFLQATGGAGQQVGGGQYRGTAPGLAGVGTAGDMLIAGGTGASAFAPTDTYDFVGASGGASFWGGGGAGSYYTPYSSTNPGQAGQAYGSGGGGASCALGYSALGGNGAAGVIVIFEFP